MIPLAKSSSNFRIFCAAISSAGNVGPKGTKEGAEEEEEEEDDFLEEDEALEEDLDEDEDEDVLSDDEDDLLLGMSAPEAVLTGRVSRVNGEGGRGAGVGVRVGGTKSGGFSQRTSLVFMFQ